MPRVLHIGFRHQNDKLISAVARHHIGATAIGLQNMPDTLENEVAFEVPVKIVHEFEAVEVHEHQGKGAASSSGPLPFRGQCFHEKAMRLDASKAVGDGLLLRFLEGKRVVKSAGNEVGQCAQQENFLLREIHRHAGLDVQNAVELFRIKNRQCDGRHGVRQQRPQCPVCRTSGAVRCHVAIARHLADEAGSERYALTQSPTPFSRFGLDHHFARSIIQHADADVIVGQARFELFGDLGEHFVRIERGDGVP